MASLRYDFSGETVLVTGASRGIGLAIARSFAAAGAEVFMLANGAGIEAAAEAVATETGARCHPIACDITDSAAVQAALAGIGRIDVLVNNAGLERITPLADTDPEVEATFRRIVDINVNGTFLVTRHALPKMRSGGRIILTASIWSRTAVPEFSAYVASKHANLGFMRAAAHELGPQGITVNAVCPGWVRTDAAMLSLANMARRSGRAEQALLDEIVGAQVLGGLLEPADMVALYLFLASDAAKDITGQAYMLDRGEVMA
ncbi:MAG: SDR family oxidoreductase [Amaricoccus sp.]